MERNQTASSDGSLPINWEKKKLSEVLTTVKGKKPKLLEEAPSDLPFPYINIKAFEKGIVTQFTDGKNCTFANEEDVLIVWDGARCGLVGKGIKGVVGSTLAKIISHEIDNRYIFYFLQSQFAIINTHPRGVGIPHVDPGIFWNIDFPLAPFSDQEGIVSKIEELFTQLDAAEAALVRAKNNLKRYKQSLLQAAVTGELTKEWREAHKDELEPVSKLLERIKAERKAKWEAEIRAKGKDPTKEKYQEPKDPDVSDLPELPDGWCWVTLSNLTFQIADVDHKMPKAVENGIPYISTKDFVSYGEIDFENSKKISDKDFQHLSRKIQPEKNDILLSRYGTVGEVRLVKTNIQFQASYSIAILKTIYEPTLINYSIFVLQSKIIQDQIRFFIRGVAQPDLGLTHIRELCFPLPPLDEQKEILSILEQIEVITEKTNSIITENIRRTESLRKSILHNAFTGNLIQPRTEESE